MNTNSFSAMTVNEVSRLTGLSVRTLQYYDKIGLLPPSGYTEAGYRLYDDTALKKLQQIMLFRELEFPLKEIKEIVSRPDFDGVKALEQQIELLKLRREHLDSLIAFAEGIKLLGVNYAMNRSKSDFSAFDKSKLDDYTKRAKEQWGNSAEYKEFEEKAKSRSASDDERLALETMSLFKEFGNMRSLDPSDGIVQAQVKKLQDFFCENFYTCTNEILRSLGEMYAGGGEFTESIDNAGGKGTAAFVHKAIEIYCK